MLAEFGKGEVKENNLTRRWFGDSYLDLYVWLDEHGTIHKFQLCYDRSHDERALTWTSPSTYSHERVDDGENRPGKNKSTPVLVPDGVFSFNDIAERFLKESSGMDSRIAAFVHQKILAFGKRVVA